MKIVVRRILVLGTSGSGKSTLASLLGHELGLPVFHLDKYFWTAGWIERPHEEMVFDVGNILRENDSFVIDGNYKRVLLEKRIESADLILILDFNRFLRIYRNFKRSLLYFKQTRPDMGDGCEERFLSNFAFIKFCWGQRKSTMLPMLVLLKKYPDKQVVHFKDQAAVNRWLEQNIL